MIAWFAPENLLAVGFNDGEVGVVIPECYTDNAISYPVATIWWWL